jgi:hypothetical protein
VRRPLNYQAITLVMLTVFIGASVILGTIARRTDKRQTEDIATAQADIRRNLRVSLGAICIVAEVIRTQPSRFPSRPEGETRPEFERRLRAVDEFLRAASRVDCAEFE